MVYYTVGLVSVVRDKILMLGKHVDIVLQMVSIVECRVIDILVYVMYLVMQKNLFLDFNISQHKLDKYRCKYIFEKVAVSDV